DHTPGTVKPIQVSLVQPVACSLSQTDGAPLWKIITSVIIGFVMRTIFKVAVKDMTSGYRVYRAACMRKDTFQNAVYAFLPEILIEAAAMQAIMVEHPRTCARARGATGGECSGRSRNSLEPSGYRTRMRSNSIT